MHPLAQKIASLQHRLVWRHRAAAACRVAAAILAVALLLGFIDYLLRFNDPGLRIMATAVLLAAAIFAGYRWWYLPSRRRLVPLLVARRVEARFPQLHDSLASALEFLQQSEDDRTAGSAQLRRLVVAETQTAVDALPLDDVIDQRPLRRATGWLAVPLLAAALFIAVDARAVATALARLAAPLGSTEWPRQHHLAFHQVPSRLAAGQAFEAELVDTTGQLPDEVRIEYRTLTNGRREFASEPMSRSGDIMVARRENVRHSFAFRAVGGDDDTMRWHAVEVIEPPQLESLNITVHPPAYTALPGASAERHLQVLAGTGIEVSGTVNKPLRAARILCGGAKPITATVAADADGNDRRAFHVAPMRWIAAESCPYRLELTDSEGVAVVVGQWNLRVEPDAPPSVSWQRPSDDLHVTAAAIVPIDLLIKDNLAIQRVELVYARSDRSESERESQPAEPHIELYRGPDRPAPLSDNATRTAGESRVVEHRWDLAPLELPVGAELNVHAEAADYRPGIGRTIGPRHISIITPEELETRLADRQAEIVRQLERGLAIERTTREEVRRLEIQQQNTGLVGDDRNAIQSAELNQRRVGHVLVDAVEGVPALVDALLAEIEMNRVASEDMRVILGRLTAELNRLSSGPLDVAERELTAAHKAIEMITPNDEARMTNDEGVNSSFVIRHSSLDSLSTAGSAQDDVIATLERLVAELSGKADYLRFARQLTELRQDQIAHQESARAEIGLDTLPLRLSELKPPQRANLQKAAGGQTALAARFEKIEHGMDGLARELADDESEAAATLESAVELARRLAIGIKMQESARDFSENRVGQALDRETEIANDLERVLDVLRRREERRPAQLVDKLRDAEKRLAALQDQLTALRQQIAQAEQQPATDPQQLEQLRKQQQALQRDIEKFAGQLERLQALDASKSARSAADRLDRGESAKDGRPSPSQDVQKAAQDLEETARQLAERRQHAEDELALEFVRRFQAELGEMVERQQRVIERTAALDSQRDTSAPLPAEAQEAIAKLAREERQLAEKAREHSELLFGLGAVRISLEEAEQRLGAAAQLLDQQQTGRAAQQAERHALARLEGMMQAFAQTASEAGQNQNQGAAAGPGGDQPQRRPTFELLEVKMLRMLQVDLNERTSDHQQRLAGLNPPLDEPHRAELEREARELAAEQGRLAELVHNMLTRDNEE
ncbi:MAG: hypothetical protein WD738_16870 [Pirellulales bacterium]